MGLGDIGTVIDTFEYAPYDTYWPRIIHIAGDVYAIFQDQGNDTGYLTTVTIAANGQIAEPIIDLWAFQANITRWPTPLHVAGNVYALAYSDTTPTGWIKTFTIAPDGTITKSIIDSLQYDSVAADMASFIQIAPYVFAVAYSGDQTDGFIKTISIAANGQIGATHIDTFEFDTATCTWPAIINVAGGVYAVVYAGFSDHGWIRTVGIGGNGQIDEPWIAEWEHDVGSANYNQIIHIAGAVFAIVYEDAGSDAQLKTVTISAGGGITESYIDGFEHDTAKGESPRIISMGGNIYAIVYEATSPPGVIKTFTIAPDGQITEPVIDTYTYEAGTCITPDIIHISGDVYAIVYTGVGNDGFLKTLGIETPVPTAPKHLPLMGIG